VCSLGHKEDVWLDECPGFEPRAAGSRGLKALQCESKSFVIWGVGGCRLYPVFCLYSKENRRKLEFG
jgi:hypothetical protein